MGLHCGYQFDKRVGRIPFDIEFGGYQWPEQLHIAVTDVPLIGPWMHGDPLRPELLTIHRHLLHIGNVPSPCIAQCGDLVDIYA